MPEVLVVIALAAFVLASMVLCREEACEDWAGCCCCSSCCTSFNGTPCEKSLSLSRLLLLCWLRWYSAAKKLANAFVLATMVLRRKILFLGWMEENVGGDIVTRPADS